jgi:hypothetical protein
MAELFRLAFRKISFFHLIVRISKQNLMSIGFRREYLSWAIHFVFNPAAIPNYLAWSSMYSYIEEIRHAKNFTHHSFNKRKVARDLVYE